MRAGEADCMCGRFAAVTEGAALAAAAWLGRGEGVPADLAAREAMATRLGAMPIRGRVVAGRGAGAGSHTLQIGDELGGATERAPAGPLETGAPSGGAGRWDLALDPLQAGNSLARGTDGALTALAAGPPGSLMPVPEMYMQKLVVPPQAAGAVDLDAPVDRNIKAVAAALERRPEDLTVVVLDRPRHEQLIKEIRLAGARVRLITDGDVSAGLAVATADAGVDMYIGIGGSTEGILTAAALRCLGGEIQARFWPVSRHQVEQVKAAGIHDIEARLSTRDMAGDGVTMAATAVTGGRFLKAVDLRADGVRTETLVLCSSCHTVRKIMAIHRNGNGGPQISLGVR